MTRSARPLDAHAFPSYLSGFQHRFSILVLFNTRLRRVWRIEKGASYHPLRGVFFEMSCCHPSFSPVDLLVRIIAAVVVVGWSGLVVANGQVIGFSVSMPVPGQEVTISVPGAGMGGGVSISDPRSSVITLTTDAEGRSLWTPSICGKHTVAAGSLSTTIWVTSRPLIFHWWDASLAQKNITSVMSDDPAWIHRGVSAVKWVGGEAYSRGIDGHFWTTASEWLSHWMQGDAADGVAIDEAFFDSGFPTDPIVHAISQLRQARGGGYAIHLWSMGFGAGFADHAETLRNDQVKVLIEDYTGDWETHLAKWAHARAYGLADQSVFGIWPGQAPLTSVAAVRADLALLRLAAPEAPGVAIFDPDPALLPAIDQAIEDFFLKPVIHLSHPANGKLRVWNLGNDLSVGFALEFLDGSGGLVQTHDLSDLTPEGQVEIVPPPSAVHARVIQPAGAIDLYEGNEQYSGGLIPVQVAGRHVWTNSSGDGRWSTSTNWSPDGPPPGNLDSGRFASFDGSVAGPSVVLAKGGETSIERVFFSDAGWSIDGDPVSQNFYTYSINSEGSGTNTIHIGISARDVVPAIFRVGTGNTLVIHGRVGAVRNSGGLRKFGLGELILNHANTFLGDTWIRGGTVSIGGSGSLGNGDYDAPITIDRGCTLRYGSSSAQRLSGGIHGEGDFVQAGPGRVILEGESASTGAVSVRGGALVVNGPLSHAGVTVEPGGLIGGTGPFGGHLHVDGTLAPGAGGIGTLTAGKVVLSGRYQCEVDGESADQLILSDHLDLTGSTLEVFPIGSGFVEEHYVIARYATLTGRFAAEPEGYKVHYHQGVGGNEIWLVRWSNYAAWSERHADGEAIDRDFDHDGIPNGVEYFTGAGAIPGESPSSLEWPKSLFYDGIYGTDYWLESSLDFETWTMVPGNDPLLLDGETLRYMIPPNEARGFWRLHVAGP